MPIKKISETLTAKVREAKAEIAEKAAERPSAFGVLKGKPAQPSSSDFKHDPLYDNLTADKQVTKEEKAQGIVSEWNGLNKVKVAETRQPKTVDDVRKALADATRKGQRISMSGARHSSGGQSIAPGSLHLDMTQMRGATYNAATKTVSVKAGTNWLDVMKNLEAHGRSVAVKQEFANFTVGGSIGVNAMGRDWRFGPIGNTVKSLTVMTADGKVVKCSRDENPELFKHVIGGMGMFGVVLEAELETVENAHYDQSFETVKVTDLDKYFKDKIASDPDAHIFSGVVSTAPGSFMQEVQVNTWKKDPNETKPVPGFKPADSNRLQTFIQNQFLNRARLGGPQAKEAFWWAYKNIMPKRADTDGVRNDALSPSYFALNPTTDDHAQALDVTVVPRDKLPQFMAKVKELQAKHGTNPFVSTVYPVKKDETAVLTAVKKDSYVVTIGVDMKRTDAEKAKADAFYKDVAQAALDLGGTMYLTHQLPFSKEQVKQGYPELAGVLEKKKQYDPNGLFDNVLVDKYGG